MPGDDGVFHLALWICQLFVVDVRVVWMVRVVELNEGLSGKEGVVSFDWKDGGFLVEEVGFGSESAAGGDAEG